MKCVRMAFGIFLAVLAGAAATAQDIGPVGQKIDPLPVGATPAEFMEYRAWIYLSPSANQPLQLVASYPATADSCRPYVQPHSVTGQLGKTFWFAAQVGFLPGKFIDYGGPWPAATPLNPYIQVDTFLIQCTRALQSTAFSEINAAVVATLPDEIDRLIGAGKLPPADTAQKLSILQASMSTLSTKVTSLSAENQAIRQRMRELERKLRDRR